MVKFYLYLFIFMNKLCGIFLMIIFNYREHKKMKMTIEDYIQKQRDITYLKLTREVQEVQNFQQN